MLKFFQWEEWHPWKGDLPRGWTAFFILINLSVMLFGGCLFEEYSRKILFPAAFVLLSTLLFLKKAGGASYTIPEKCGFARIQPGTPLLLTGALFFCITGILILNSGSLAVLEWLGLPFDAEQSLVSELKCSELPEQILICLLSVFMAPVTEELLFRRLLYAVLLPEGKWKAFFLTALFFSLIHFFLPGAAGLFLTGIVLQFLYLKTGNLLVSIQLHISINFLTFLIAFAQSFQN